MNIEQLTDGTWYVSDKKYVGCWAVGETIKAAIEEFESVVRSWKLDTLAHKMANDSYTVAQRWPLLARNCPDALDELEAHWRHALESGAHVEGDWRDIGLVGNERHRFDHAKAWANNGNKEDLKGQTGRGLMVSQLMIEAKRNK